MQAKCDYLAGSGTKHMVRSCRAATPGALKSRYNCTLVEIYASTVILARALTLCYHN
jgi:hypothetical protein